MWKIVGSVTSKELPKSWNSQWLQLPTPIFLSSNLVRVFFATRNDQNRSRIVFCDLQFSDSYESFEITDFSESPVLVPGEVGTYSQDGIYPSSIIQIGGSYFLYTIGWIRGAEDPLFSASIGLAIGKDARTFSDHANAPIMDRSKSDPTLVTSPNVIGNSSGYRMFYTSGIGWSRDVESKILGSRYHIKFADSTDGIDWKRNGDVAVDLWKGVTNVARPSVIECSDGSYLMSFCYFATLANHYKLGFAVSNDLTKWSQIGTTQNEIVNTPASFNSYPSLLQTERGVLLFANDLDRGKDGFSVAFFGA